MGVARPDALIALTPARARALSGRAGLGFVPSGLETRGAESKADSASAEADS